MKRRYGLSKYKVEYSTTPPSRGFCESEPEECCKHCTEWWQDEWVKVAEYAERKRAKIKNLKDTITELEEEAEKELTEANDELILEREQHETELAELRSEIKELNESIDSRIKDEDDYVEEIGRLKQELAAARQATSTTSINYF